MQKWILVSYILGFAMVSGCGGGAAGSPSSSEGGSPLAATHFALTAPSSATSRTLTSLTVAALDAANQTAASYSGTVHFSSTDQQAVLPPNSTLTAGMGSFSVTFETAGAQTITAADTTTPSIAEL